VAFAENLRRARIKRFWTQAVLSRESGISEITIARLEAGKHTPSARTVVALAKALSVEPASLADPEELAAEREKEAA
jgi:transcriptional regulator with XRE-family HTH domain